MKKAILPLLALLLSAAVGTTRAAVVTVPELTVTDIAVTTALATWTACDGVTSYILQLASDNQFTTSGSSKTLTETFANATFSPGGGSYVDQNISGGDLGNWTATQCRGDKGAPVIRCGGTLTSPSFNGSVSKVEFDYEWPFSESGSCEIELYVNGTYQGTATVTGGTAGTATYTLKTPVDGPFTIELRNQATSNKRMQVTEVRIFTVASGSGSLIAEETITDGTSYTFTGLMPKTTYFARVKGNADWSNVVEFTTTWSELPAQTVTLSSNDDTKGSVMTSRRLQDTDLSVGSIIQAGDILSLTKYDLNLNEYRWRTDKILYPESKCVISKSNKEVIFGLDAVWTNPNHEKFYPLTEEKTDGNAWQMTRVNKTMQRIYISGIQTDQVLLPAGVTRNANGSYNVVNGTQITIVAVAQEGCHITGWSNGDNPITTGVSYYDYAYDTPQRCPAISVLDITVDQDMDLRVNFAENTFNVTLATSDNTKGSVMTSRRFQDTDLSVGSIIQGGDILSLTNCDLFMEENRWRKGNLIPPAQFVIEKTEGDVIFGVDAAWDNKYYPVTETMSDGNAWQVTQVYQDIGIYVAGIQTDQVLLPAGVTRNANGSYNVVNGTHLTVVAMAQEGCHITGWSNGDNPITTGVSYYDYAYDTPQRCPAISVLDITVDQDMDLRANFAENTFNVTLATSDDSKGTVITTRRIQDTDLQMKDLIQTGDILTLTKFDLYMEEGRWKMNDNIQNDPALLKKDKFETLVFGPNASWTNPYNLVLSPVDETGNDGNVWKVTNIIDFSTTHRIYIVGIKYPYDIVKLPTGVTRNDDGSYNVVNGTRLYLKAMAKEGCHVTGWSNGDTPIEEGVSNSNFAYTSPDKCPAVSELEITVNGDMDIRANFAENAFDVNFTALNANTIENGKAIVKVNGTPATLTDGTLKSVEPGSTISITPSEGYRVAAKSDGLDNLRAASQKDATVTINYVYKDDNSSTFVSNGDNTFTFVSGTGHGGGDAVIEKKLVVKDGLLVFSQKFAMADDRETFYFTFDPNEDTYSCAIPLQYIAGYHVDFTSIIVNGTDITSNLYGGKYKTGVTFKMPVEALNVTYELVRDLSVGTAINLYIDNELVTDDTRLIVKQDDTYGYVPTVPLTVSLTDEIEGVTLTPQQIIAAGITPVILLKVKYNWSPVASFNPLTNLPDDIEPGQTYSIRLKGTDGSAYYDQTPRTSAVTLFDGYKMDVPAGSYITYYRDEALCVDDADLQLYTVTAVNDESVSLTAIPSANAEMPFLIYNGSDQPKTALLIPTKDEINQAVAPQFKGTLTAQEMPASSATTDYYVLSGNAFVWVKDSGTIPANKCWLEMDKTTNAPAKLRITETTGATGIAGISGISGPSALYDLQGRKVLHPTLRGIYIQNGKKIVVK